VRGLTLVYTKRRVSIHHRPGYLISPEIRRLLYMRGALPAK
jgi:hypothetical protein